jgi:hypothetical protein
MFLMLYSPLDTALLLVLLQPSVMATFGCVAQKAASAAQPPFMFKKKYSSPRTFWGSRNSAAGISTVINGNNTVVTCPFYFTVFIKIF